MTNCLYDTDIISIHALDVDQINLSIKIAKNFKKKIPSNLLANKLIANCFFEPSTRTRLSFETAALRLGAQVIGFTSEESTSVKKGETLQDSIKVISNYADLIVIRHSKEGSACLAAEVSNKPVINAGDGSNQHPTQALTDLFTIYECQKKINGLSLALVGDLKYGRTIHSLVQALALFDVRLFFISHPLLSLPDRLGDYLKRKNIRFSFHTSLEEVINKVDILYMTRLQQERLLQTEYEIVNDPFRLTIDLLKKVKSNLRILHPLPRMYEMTSHIDETPYAYYFQQAANGVYLRAAVLALSLNKEFPVNE